MDKTRVDKTRVLIDKTRVLMTALAEAGSQVRVFQCLLGAYRCGYLGSQGTYGGKVMRRPT